MLSHSLWSPDLSPSDYCLFHNMKKWLSGEKLGSNDQVFAKMNTYCRVWAVIYLKEKQNILYRTETWLFWIKKQIFTWKCFFLLRPGTYDTAVVLDCAKNIVSKRKSYESILQQIFCYTTFNIAVFHTGSIVFEFWAEKSHITN